MVKKGIALLLTLSFLIISLSIIGSVFLLYKKLTNNNFEYSIAENSFIIESVSSKLKNIKINSSNDVDKLFFYKFSLEKNEFKVFVSFSPVFDRINLNNILRNNKVNDSMMNFLDLIFDKYNIEDSEFLKALILDTIDTDKEEREDKSEISLYEPFENGQIYNQKQFQKIIDYYYNITKDKNIYKIPFKDIFSFNAIYTDCNHLSYDIKNILGVQSCSDLKSLYDKKFLRNLNIHSFNKKAPYYVWVNVVYFRYKKKFKIRFLYDIVNKKILKIDKKLVY